MFLIKAGLVFIVVTAFIVMFITHDEHEHRL